MSTFVCPLCKGPLARDEHRLFCEHGHSFDLAAEGYVNLLLPNKMNSKQPGDSKEMAAARSAFLNKGYYAPLCGELCSAVLKISGGRGISVLDCGCGEGYYTARICEALENAGTKPIFAGVDISRPSVRRAAKRTRDVEFAVASVFELPVPCSSFDVLLNVFSPLCEEEYLRVLKPGGYYLYVVPAARHLWQMKEAIYDSPYENSEKLTPYSGFEYADVRRVRYEITLEHREDIAALFAMTPYFWRTSAKGAEKLAALDTLKTEVAFDIHIFKKL